LIVSARWCLCGSIICCIHMSGNLHTAGKGIAGMRFCIGRAKPELYPDDCTRNPWRMKGQNENPL
jgi:hypothetical protein